MNVNCFYMNIILEVLWWHYKFYIISLKINTRGFKHDCSIRVIDCSIRISLCFGT